MNARPLVVVLVAKFSRGLLLLLARRRAFPTSFRYFCLHDSTRIGRRAFKPPLRSNALHAERIELFYDLLQVRIICCRHAAGKRIRYLRSFVVVMLVQLSMGSTPRCFPLCCLSCCEFLKKHKRSLNGGLC